MYNLNSDMYVKYVFLFTYVFDLLYIVFFPVKQNGFQMSEFRCQKSEVRCQKSDV